METEFSAYTAHTNRNTHTHDVVQCVTRVTRFGRARNWPARVTTEHRHTHTRFDSRAHS